MMQLTIAAFALLFTFSGYAAGIDDVAWLAGRWTGNGLGGQCEETWSPPAGGAMIGTFRLLRNGKPVFYEFLTLSEIDGRLSLRLKHFNPDTTGWEAPEKYVEFRHVRSTAEVIEFEGLTFRREGANRLRIAVTIRAKDGKVRDEIFEMVKRPVDR